MLFGHSYEEIILLTLEGKIVSQKYLSPLDSDAVYKYGYMYSL